MTTFSDPGTGGDNLPLKDVNGSLLICEPTSVETGITTVHGPSDAVKATVHVVDGPLAGTTYTDTLIFPKVLQSQLGSKIGQKVLGRLGQGVAKPGQSAPWTLNPASPADHTAAEAFLAARPAAPALANPGDLI
jgi:hypothetical protein